MDVELYQMADGTEPVADFLQGLDKPMYAKAMKVIDLLVTRGFHLRAPYSKSLGDGIMELRITTGNNAARILYFFIVGNTAILTNGFTKKAQKTPSEELDRAKRYRNDYMRRNLK